MQCNGFQQILVIYVITSSGKTSLETITKDSHRFIHDFRGQLRNLIEHDFVAKQQSSYLKWRQENIQPNEIVLIYDFSENYTCIMQDSVQAFHWSSQQVTVHPICMYFKGADGKLKNQTFVIISECLDHNFLSVFAFQRKLVDYLRRDDKFQHINKLTIFSDGAPTQYKNKYNFYNACLFKQQFGLDVEMHYFATAHGMLLIHDIVTNENLTDDNQNNYIYLCTGKSACDAIGANVKRSVRRQAIQGGTITNPREFFEACKKMDSSIEFEFCSHEDVRQAQEILNHRYENVKIKTIPGTLQYHGFIPKDEQIIDAKRTSFSNLSKQFITAVPIPQPMP